MRRYQGRSDRFMGYETQPPMMPALPASQLDAKDERLLELSLEVGRLQGANDLLVEDNGRLEDDNATLRKANVDYSKRIIEFERADAAASAGHKSASDILDEFEQEIKKRKERK